MKKRYILFFDSYLFTLQEDAIVCFKNERVDLARFNTGTIKNIVNVQTAFSIDFWFYTRSYYHNNENSRNQLVVQYCFINNASNSGKAILEFIKEMIENKNGTEDYVKLHIYTLILKNIFISEMYYNHDKEKETVNLNHIFYHESVFAFINIKCIFTI